MRDQPQETVDYEATPHQPFSKADAVAANQIIMQSDIPAVTSHRHCDLAYLLWVFVAASFPAFALPWTAR